MFGSLGFQELLIILVIIIFLFGARRIPEIARGIGQGIRGFRSELRGEEEKTSEADQGEGTSEERP